MSNPIGGLTGSVVEYALDGLSLRQAAIASNIANTHSAGYRPVQVNFENYLADALSGPHPAASGSDRIKALPDPLVSQQSGTPGAASATSVELQTVLLNQNVVQYQALITGLNKYMSVISAAISEGKR